MIFSQLCNHISPFLLVYPLVFLFLLSISMSLGPIKFFSQVNSTGTRYFFALGTTHATSPGLLIYQLSSTTGQWEIFQTIPGIQTHSLAVWLENGSSSHVFIAAFRGGGMRTSHVFKTDSTGHFEIFQTIGPTDRSMGVSHFVITNDYMETDHYLIVPSQSTNTIIYKFDVGQGIFVISREIETTDSKNVLYFQMKTTNKRLETQKSHWVAIPTGNSRYVPLFELSKPELKAVAAAHTPNFVVVAEKGHSFMLGSQTMLAVASAYGCGTWCPFLSTIYDVSNIENESPVVFQTFTSDDQTKNGKISVHTIPFKPM